MGNGERGMVAARSMNLRDLIQRIVYISETSQMHTMHKMPNCVLPYGALMTNAQPRRQKEKDLRDGKQGEKACDFRANSEQLTANNALNFHIWTPNFRFLSSLSSIYQQKLFTSFNSMLLIHLLNDNNNERRFILIFVSGLQANHLHFNPSIYEDQ
jgi:hypothetical protein